MRNKLLALIIVLNALLLISGCSTKNIPSFSNNADSSFVELPKTDIDKTSEQNSQISTIGNDISKVAQSVLFIQVYDDTDTLTASGSGFLIDDGVTLVTNFHVISDAYKVIASSADGTMQTNANVLLGYNKTTDIAILKCEEDLGLLPLQIENTTPRQGDYVYAIGYPLGVANSVSDGIVSSVYKNDDGTTIIQITAPISHGSSGGALINERGQVVGVTSAFYSSGQNLNIAVASNHISELLFSEAGNEIPLMVFYQLSPHPHTVSQILEFPNKFDGTEQIIEGYVSSVFAYTIGESTVIDYYIVDNHNDVFGYNYPSITNIDNIINEIRIENKRSLHYGAITFEVEYAEPSTIIPGQYISLQAQVGNNSKIEVVTLDNVKILEVQ